MGLGGACAVEVGNILKVGVSVSHASEHAIADLEHIQRTLGSELAEEMNRTERG